jgi:DNA-binding Lrp family transcriptional regulator
VCGDCTLNCTLTEKAILEFLHGNPTATQAEVAAAIGKSLRTVKTDMAALQEKGLLKREGARKNGRWVVE